MFHSPPAILTGATIISTSRILWKHRWILGLWWKPSPVHVTWIEMKMKLFLWEGPWRRGLLPSSQRSSQLTFQVRCKVLLFTQTFTPWGLIWEDISQTWYGGDVSVNSSVYLVLFFFPSDITFYKYSKCLKSRPTYSLKHHKSKWINSVQWKDTILNIDWKYNFDFTVTGVVHCVLNNCFNHRSDLNIAEKRTHEEIKTAKFS